MKSSIGKAKIKLLLVIPRIASYRLFLNELASALVARGVEVHLATQQESIAGEKLDTSKIAAIHHPVELTRGSNPITHIVSACKLNKLIDHIKPDLIHVHFSSATFTVALSRCLKFFKFPPVTATIHGLTFVFATGFKGFLTGLAEMWALKRMNQAWVINQDDVEALIKIDPKFPIKCHKSKGLGCRLDIYDRCRFSEDDKAELRRGLGLKDEDFTFIFVGRFVAFKGFDYTIRAFLHLLEEHPNVRLLLCGGFDKRHSSGLGEKETEAMLECEAILNLGWTNHVDKFLSVSQVTLFPSKREGVPVNLMESIAMGVPVITRNSRGCRDVVRDNYTGLVLDEITDESLSAAMEKLLLNAKMRSLYSDNAIKDRDTFDRQKWIREQLAIYDDLLK